MRAVVGHAERVARGPRRVRDGGEQRQPHALLYFTSWPLAARLRCAANAALESRVRTELYVLLRFV